MSLAAYVWVADLPLSACGATAFRVLLKYADRVDELGYHGWHSEPFLADALGCTTRSIRRARLELTDAGLLRLSEDQSAVDKFRADRRPRVYDVMTTALRMHEAHGGTFMSSRGLHGGTRGGQTGGHRLSTETSTKPLTKTSRELVTFRNARAKNDGGS